MISIITLKRIQGQIIELPNQDMTSIDNDNETDSEKKYYASINEILDWKRVNPFSPLLNGDFL